MKFVDDYHCSNISSWYSSNPIPTRPIRFISSYLTSCHPISISIFFSISSHPMSPHFIPFHPTPSHPISLHPTPSTLVSLFYLVLLHHCSLVLLLHFPPHHVPGRYFRMKKLTHLWREVFRCATKCSRRFAIGDLFLT